MSQPWIKFFPRDWASDTGLRACSLEARGLWIEMIGLMIQSSDPGFIPASWTADECTLLARAVGSDKPAVIRALSELVSCGVASIDGLGRVFCRRLLRDVQRLKTNRENGLHGGNPTLQKARKPRSDKGSVGRSDKSRARADSGLRTQDSETHREEAPSEPVVAHAPTRPRPPGGTPATRAWDRLWVESGRAPYAWTKAKAILVAKAMQFAGGDLEEFERRAERLLSSHDQWDAEHADLELLVKRWNVLGHEAQPVSHLDKYLFEIGQNGAAAQAARRSER